MEEKERAEKVSPVAMAVQRAEAAYKTPSMQDLIWNFDGPPKYLNQRDAPLEIPVEVVRKLFNVMDTDLDDAISLDELQRYITKCKLPIEKEVTEAMYFDAINTRAKPDDGSGLLMEEI